MTDASTDPTVAALRQEIEQTREELGETVEALAAKVDVKARAQEAAEETKERVREAAAEAKTKTVEKAQLAAVASRELAQEVRADPAGATRRAAGRMRASIRENPRQWAITGAALMAFVLLMMRRRRVQRAKRFSTPWEDL
jgi:hypothetical protein